MSPLSSTQSRLGLRSISATDESQRWFDRARQVLAGGVSSSARSTTTGSLAYPLYISRGRGARIWDVDENEFIDYLLSYGSCILGHGDVELSETIVQQVELGTMFGTCNTVEVQLAEQICRMVPCADLVRFANSGSEAIQGAIRAARGFTGKTKILKFEGHYHGWVDVLAVSNRPSVEQSGPVEAPYSAAHSRGLPQGVISDVVICPWNEPAILRNILDQHGDDLAAVIAEPIVANNACIMPQPRYLELLREECDRRGIVLIFDEIVTGFRVAAGGAQALFDVVPDMAVYSKALGGGLPISAFVGRRAIMDMIASNSIKHGGTYNGSPLCAAAALHTLQTLERQDVQDRLRESGESIIYAIRRAARDRNVECIVQGVGSMFQVIFGSNPQPPRHYRDLAGADVNRFAAFRQALLENGLHCNASGMACFFVSTAHTSADTRLAVDAVDKAMKAIS